MQNGQIENHVTKTMDTSSPQESHLNPEAENMADTVEFRLMRAYAQRRRPNPTGKDESPAADKTPPQTPEKTEKEEKKKRRKKTIWRHLKPILRCVKPQVEEPEPTGSLDGDAGDPKLRSFVEVRFTHEDELEELAGRVIGIAAEIQFTSELEPDSNEEDDMEKMIGLLLREEGDRLTQQFDLAHIAADLYLDYNYFKRLLNTFLVRIGFRSPTPDALGPQAATKTQIAVTCEITSRLTSVEALPRALLLQHGARYLQEYYSQWAQQQGGYEEVFQDEEQVD